MGSAQSRWVLKFGPIVPRKLGANGSLLTRRWREMDSNPRSPVRSLTQTRSNGDVQHPCAASRMMIGTQIGFAIGGFAPVVAAALQGEGRNALVPVAPLNSPIGRRLDRGLDRARDPTFRCTAQGESASKL